MADGKPAAPGRGSEGQSISVSPGPSGSGGGGGVARIEEAFDAAREQGRAALMPYMMAGFPDREASLAVAAAYADAGADLIELGVPFSDPLADGPTIHAAATTALEGGADLGSALAICETVADRLPVVLMAYANMVLAHGGAEAFAARAADAGAAGAIVPDLPLGEAEQVREALVGGRARGGSPGRSHHPAGAAAAHLRGRQGLRLRRLDGRHDRRAERHPRGPARARRRDPLRFTGARRRRLRDRHAVPGGAGGRDRRRRDHRQPAGPRRRRRRLPRGGGRRRCPRSCGRRPSPSQVRMPRHGTWSSPSSSPLGATTIVYAWLGQGGGVSGLVFLGVCWSASTIRAVRSASS